MKISEKNKDFFENVYDVARLIPEGRVTSYGAIAKYLGAARSARMVGWAMNGSGKYPDVPAHRVVNRNGMLTGRHHFADPNQMEQRLISEGVEVINDQVQHLKRVFWDPNAELNL